MLHIYFFCLTKNIFYDIIIMCFGYFDCTFYIYFFIESEGNKMNNLQYVDLFDVCDER